MKSFSICSAVLACLVTWTHMAHASAAECSATLPAGVIIRVLPDETLTAGTASGPTILTVSSDVRFFPNRPPLLGRGSKVLATIVESKQAGHFRGKARLRLALRSILTSDFCEYPIDARIVEASRNKVGNDVVWGRGHAQRDVIALLFPPTTIYQFLRIPSRGPKLVLDNETSMTIKLLQPVSLGEASARISEDVGLGALRAANPQTSGFQEQQVPRATSTQCPTMQSSSIRPLLQRNKIVRPVRNLTPYHVSVYLNRTPVAILPPCYGPSMITTPDTEFQLEAAASLPITGGQARITVKLVLSPDGNGWDVVPDMDQPVALTAH